MANLLEKASIVLTPTGYSKDVLHNVKPSESPFGDMTHIINSQFATRVNAQGLVETVTSDIPRIDYSKGSGAILSELASTNQIRYSEDFSNALWLKTAVTLTSSTGTNPRGNSATIYAIQGAPLQGGLEANMASSASSNGVGVSCWVRKKDGTGTTNVQIGMYDSGYFFNTVSVGAEWQRITYTSTGSTTATRFYIRPHNILPADTIEVWGAQMEKTVGGQEGRVTSYIPTTSGASTRPRDNYLNGGDATLIGAQEGVLFFEGAASSNAYTGRAIALSADNSADNRVVLYFDGGSNQVRTTIQAPSVFITFSASGITQTNFNKIAVKYKSGDISLWVNGVEVATSSQSFTFSAALNELAFDQGNGSQHFDGHVKQLVVFKEVLSDAELAALTS